MKHTQDEEKIRELLDAMAELTYLYKRQNKDLSVSARMERFLRKVSREGLRSTVMKEARKLKAYFGKGQQDRQKVKSALPQQRYDYFRDEQIAVYMAPFGGYDQIREPICRPDNIDYYILTDQELPAESRWKRLDVQKYVPQQLLQDPAMANRWCKMHPHLIFPEYSISVYLDSNYLITSDLTGLVNRMTDYPAAMFRHKGRRCVYDEITACIEQKKDSRERLTAHREVLLEKGIPENYGLLEAPVIVRKHNDEECIRLMDTWWSMLCSGCRRDQIALIEALWELKITPEKLASLGDDFRKCDLFATFKHSKGQAGSLTQKRSK